jgi:hypothetical protein
MLIGFWNRRTFATVPEPIGLFPVPPMSAGVSGR